jgi:L-iditol 2-dehydrogenase
MPLEGPMPANMRQAVIVAADRFEVRAAARPAPREAGEVLLRAAACGLCSGDLMPWYLAKKVGGVLGHEPVGWAVEVGAAVEHIEPGDLVFVHHHAPCGVCEECRRGAAVHCRAWRSSALDPGGMAEWIRVPSGIVREDCFAIDLPPEEGLFIEPLGCCVKAFRRLVGEAGRSEEAEGTTPTLLRSVAKRTLPPTPCLKGLRVAVVGCGVMGLLNLQAARAFGAAEVLAVEPDSFRREAARRSADRVFTPEQAERELHRGADVVVVGPGFPDVIRQALGYVRDAGQACLFTPTATGVLTPLDLGELYFREVSLTPSYSCGPEDTRLAYDLLRAGRVRPGPLITHRFPLEEVQTAYDTARRGGAAIKVVVTFAREAPS